MAKRSFEIQLQGHQYKPQCGPQHCLASLKLFRETGCVNKKGYPHERAFRKLTVPLELTVIHLVLSRPGIYLREIQVELREAMGAEIGPSAICRFLNKVGFSRQRMKLVALQRDKAIRAQFVSDVSIYEPEMLIFR